MADLPTSIQEALAQLDSEDWRERKIGVATLIGELGALAADPPMTRLLCEHLVHTIISVEGLYARAASHDVLVAIGPSCLEVVREKIAARVPGCRMLVDLLGEVGGPGDVPFLDELLRTRHDDENLQAAAATALGQIGGKPAADSLIELTRSDAEMLRVYALDALRNMNADVGPAVLEPFLGSAVTRRVALALAASSSDPGVPKLLVPWLGDKRGTVRAAACGSLARLVQRLRSDPEIAAIMVSAGEPARARLRELLSHDDPQVRASAAALVCTGDDLQALRQALPALSDPLVLERALSCVRARGSVLEPLLAGALDDAVGPERVGLFRLVAALGEPATDPKLNAALAEALGDEDSELAQSAAEALQFVGSSAELPALSAAMARPSQVGGAAADAVAEILRRNAGPRRDGLLALCGGNLPSEGAVAGNFCRAAARLEWEEHVPQLVGLLGAIDVNVRAAAAHAIGSIPGDHEGAGALAFALADEDPMVRASACRSLGQLRAAGSMHALIGATSDESAQVRAAAVRALVQLDNDAAVRRLREIISEDPVPSVVVHAIAGLGRTRSEHDLSMLMSLCTSEDPEVVKAAVRTLGVFDEHRATAALLGLLDHARWDVRRAAAEVLGQRGDKTAIGPLNRALEQEADAPVHATLREAIRALEGETA